jgi:hypothetical protein
MAEKLDKKQTISMEELVVSQMWEMQALYNLLEKKGMMTKNELLEEIQRIRKTEPKR